MEDNRKRFSGVINSRLLWLLPALALAACNSTHRTELSGERTVSHAGKDASCPFITETPDGKIVLSWIETDKGQDSGMVYYAVSADRGQSFSAPQAIAATQGVLPHAENLPKLVFKPDGEVIAMYGVEQHDARNKYAGRVLFTRSPDGGKSWLPAQPLVTDTASYDQRYFDMALLPGGQAAAIWLDNRKETDAEGSTLYYAVTAPHKGFEQERPLAQTICQCCRTDLYADAGGAIHAAFRDIINDSIRDMVHMVSADGGATFSTPVRISADNWVLRGCPHTGPTMAGNSHGLHFAWFTMGGGQGVFYCQSADNGKTYTKKEAVSKAPMAKHPQIAALGNDCLLLVWDEPVKTGNTFNSRVGLQCRSGSGAAMESLYLTPDTAYATFPVIKALDNRTALVAYTKRAGGLGQVEYRIVTSY